jgi:hypothetical protein
MAELEASLLCSRKALLALDLAAIERQTDEQTDLVRRFEKLLGDGMLAPASQVKKVKQETLSTANFCAPSFGEEVRHNARRIAEAARLQAALLTRAQHKLRVLANMLAGPSVTYGPFQSCGRALTADFCTVAGERI